MASTIYFGGLKKRLFPIGLVKSLFSIFFDYARHPFIARILLSTFAIYQLNKFNKSLDENILLLQKQEKVIKSNKDVIDSLVTYVNTFEKSDRQYFESLCTAFRQATKIECVERDGNLIE